MFQRKIDVTSQIPLLSESGREEENGSGCLYCWFCSIHPTVLRWPVCWRLCWVLGICKWMTITVPLALGYTSWQRRQMHIGCSTYCRIVWYAPVWLNKLLNFGKTKLVNIHCPDCPSTCPTLSTILPFLPWPFLRHLLHPQWPPTSPWSKYRDLHDPASALQVLD